MRSSEPTTEPVATEASPTADAGTRTSVRLGVTPPAGADGDGDQDAVARTRPSTLPLVALVLGIAGAALGVVVVWYIAAIVLGVAAIAVGIVALRRTRTGTDARGHSRATIGMMLGAIAVVLGVSAAILLPHAVDRVDNFFSTMQNDVNHNVDSVNRGLRADVSSLDRSTARDLRRVERQNRSDLDQLERRSNESLTSLGERLDTLDGKLTDAERRDLAALEQSLRTDIRNLDAALRSSSDDLGGRVAKLEQEMADIQRELHG
jgi:hypothetical protein